MLRRLEKNEEFAKRLPGSAKNDDDKKKAKRMHTKHNFKIHSLYQKKLLYQKRTVGIILKTITGFKTRKRLCQVTFSLLHTFHVDYEIYEEKYRSEVIKTTINEKRDVF